MSVTKLVLACFDLHEGSLNIIIHNLFCVYWYVLYLCDLDHRLSSGVLFFRTFCQSIPPHSHGGAVGGQAICLLLIHNGI